MADTYAVMVNGEIVSDGDGVPVALDDGLIRGDGIFEGIRLYGRAPRTPDLHLERLARSGAGTGIPVDADRLRRELAEFCEAVHHPDCGVRLMLTRGGHVIWREEPLPVFPDGVALHPVANRVTPLLVGVKTLSYASNMRAVRMAKAEGADDALCFNADDRVILEGPTTAFGWLEGETLVFPPLDLGVLDSITRRLAMDAVPSTTRAMPIDGLADADGAVLMSSYLEVAPVREVQGIATFDVEAAAVRRLVDTVNTHIRGLVETVRA